MSGGEEETVVNVEPSSNVTVGAPTTGETGNVPASPSQDSFHAPPVMDGIEEATVTERISSSLAGLQSRMSSLVQDSSSSMSRAIKNVVPPARLGKKSPYPMIVAFGDSITERGETIWDKSHPNGWGTGWVARLSHHFAARADVVCRGFSGYNSRCALHLVHSVMSGVTENATVVLLWFGANDAVLRGRGDQHVSVEEYGLNLAKLVLELDNLKKTTPILPVLMTPPPIQDELVAPADGTLCKRENSTTALYATKCVEIARRMEVPCIDVYTELLAHAGSQEGLKKYLVDGLHLSDAGNAFVSELVVKELQATVPSLSDEKLKKWFPSWNELHWDNLQADFR